MHRIYAIAAAAAAVALIGATWVLTVSRGDALAACLSPGVIRGSAEFGGPFTLVNHRGDTVTDAEVITKPTLIYFGYTFCPDVCPFDAARNAAAVDILAEQGIDVQTVFVSVDPERDTTEVLAEFVGYMHPEMVGLNGDPDQVNTAAKAYKAIYSKGSDEGDGYYLMNHSAFTYLAVPEHGVVGIFHKASDTTSQLGTLREGVTEEEVAAATACILDAV